MFCELINAEYFMKKLKITSMFVSRMTVATKLLKMCLSNILIDDEIFKGWKTIPVTILFVNISLATTTSSTVTSSKLNVEIPRNGNMIHYEIWVEGVLETPTLY